MSSSDTMLQLARAVVQDAEALDGYLRTHNLPQPSFDKDGPSKLMLKDPEAINAQERLLSNTKALYYLAQGPTAALMGCLRKTSNLSVLSVIHTFNIAKHVPLDGHISYEQLAEAVGLPRSDLKSIVRLAMTDFVFCEPTPGYIGHTAASRLLEEDILIKPWFDLFVDERFPASAKLAPTLLQHPGSDEPTLSAWGVENKAQLHMFGELAARHPERGARLAGTMEYFASLIPYGATAKAIDWASLGKAVVVDVGGGKGPVAIELAQTFPDLRMIVQDIEDVCISGRQQLPDDVRGRVSFMQHDFLSPQPLRDVDVFFFRAVFHNWPDKYVIKIIRNLIPGLKVGSKIVFQDPVFPLKGELSPHREEIVANNNITMMTYFNSHDREEDEWPVLFAKADSRFQVRCVMKEDTFGRMGTFEAILKGQ